MDFTCEQSHPCTRLSAVIKRPETSCFQASGRFETWGSNLRYGIPKEVATAPYHSRKVTIASTSKRAGQKSVISKKFDFVNKSLFPVVELKRSIPRPFYSHLRTAPKVWGTFGGWKWSELRSHQTYRAVKADLSAHFDTNSVCFISNL